MPCLASTISLIRSPAWWGIMSVREHASTSVMVPAFTRAEEVDGVVDLCPISSSDLIPRWYGTLSPPPSVPITSAAGDCACTSEPPCPHYGPVASHRFPIHTPYGYTYQLATMDRLPPRTIDRRSGGTQSCHRRDDLCLVRGADREEAQPALTGSPPPSTSPPRSAASTSPTASPRRPGRHGRGDRLQRPPRPAESPSRGRPTPTDRAAPPPADLGGADRAGGADAMVPACSSTTGSGWR